MEDCFWQYNEHLPIRIQQEIQVGEVKLTSSKQKIRNARTVFAKSKLISQFVLVVSLVNK